MNENFSKCSSSLFFPPNSSGTFTLLLCQRHATRCHPIRGPIQRNYSGRMLQNESNDSFFLSFFFFVFLLCLCNIVDLWRESAWMHSAEAGFERKKNRNQNTKTKKKKRNRNEEEKEFRPLRNSCGRNDADAFTSIPFGVKLPTAFFYSLRSVISPLSVALLYGDLSV